MRVVPGAIAKKKRAPKKKGAIVRAHIKHSAAAAGIQERGFAGQALPAITINRKTGHASKASQLRRVRAKRSIILSAIKHAQAQRLRDGTITQLRVANRQLLNQSRLIRGV